jgi:hypothetical protein
MPVPLAALPRLERLPKHLAAGKVAVELVALLTAGVAVALLLRGKQMVFREGQLQA